MLVPIPTFFNVVAFSNLPMQNSIFPRGFHALKMLFCFFLTYYLQMIAAISHIFQCDIFLITP